MKLRKLGKVENRILTMGAGANSGLILSAWLPVYLFFHEIDKARFGSFLFSFLPLGIVLFLAVKNKTEKIVPVFFWIGGTMFGLALNWAVLYLVDSDFHYFADMYIKSI